MITDIRHKVSALLLLALALVIGSCSDETEETADSSRLRFAVSVADLDDAASTRATQGVATLKLDGDIDGQPLYLHLYAAPQGATVVTRADAVAADVAELPDQLSIQGYASDGTTVFDGTVNKADSWISTVNWPRNKDELRFLSMVGTNVPSGSLTYSGSSWTLPQYTFISVPDEDVLFALSNECNGSTYQVVDMQYRHIFSSIGVMTRTVQKGTVFKSISFKGIAASGIYKPAAAAAGDTWEVPTSDTTRDLTFDLGSQESEGQAYQYLTDRTVRYIVVPQTLGSDTSVELTVVADGVEKTLTASLEGVTWKEGTNMWCVVSTSAINWIYTLDVDLNSPANLTYQGGNVGFTVKSYKTSASGTIEPVEWKAEYLADGGTVYEATNDMIGTGSTAAYASDGGTVQTGNLVITASPARTTTTMQFVNEERGTDTPFDLSLNDISTSDIKLTGMTTANCYIVSAPGIYKFPLVRGNAYKNGVLNAVAFNTADGSYNSDNGAEITGAVSAPVLRTTVSGIIKDPGIIEGKYVKFEVPKDKIKVGNAIIAACDASGNVLWSWHIWFVSFSESDLEPDFLPYNLGWIPDDTYDERSVTVRISQTEGNGTNLSSTFTVSQSADSKTTNACLYYQWGRKDPFPFATESSLAYTSGNQSLADGILNPGVPYYSSVTNEWYRDVNDDYWWWTTYNHYSDLWNGTTKTIYDPSPAGYRVPTSTEMAAATGLSEKGCYFYYPTSSTYKSSYSSLYYWTSSWNSSSGSYGQPYYYGSSGSTSGYNSYYAMPIRPVKEK